MDSYDVLVVGCGLSGIVIAEQFANKLNKSINKFDLNEKLNIFLYI